MLKSINSEFNRAKKLQKDDTLIVESVLDVEEVLPGSDEEIDDIVDADSVPDDVYNKVDKALDDLVSKEDYDDTAADELLEDIDDDDDEITDEELDAVITECTGAWEDDENIGHPNTARRTNPNHQPAFHKDPENQM